eukprot:11713290-Karenia_brevis.AAC.1
MNNLHTSKNVQHSNEHDNTRRFNRDRRCHTPWASSIVMVMIVWIVMMVTIVTSGMNVMMMVTTMMT